MKQKHMSYAIKENTELLNQKNDKIYARIVIHYITSNRTLGKINIMEEVSSKSSERPALFVSMGGEVVNRYV